MNSLLQNKGETPLTADAPVLRAEVDSTLKYFLIFLLLGFGSAVYFSYLTAIFSATPSMQALLEAAGIGCVFITIVIFQSFFIQSFYFNLILIVLHTFGIFGFFYRPFSSWFVWGGVLFLLFYLWSLSIAKREMNARIKLNFWRYSSTLLTGMVTGLALLFALLYVGLYQREGSISYQAYRFTIGSVTGLEVVAPNFSFDAKTDAFFEQYAREALKNDPRYRALSQSEQERLAVKTGAALKQQAEDATSTKAEEDATILEYGYQLIQRLFRFLQEHGLGSLIIGLIITTIFFIIKGVMFFVRWPLLMIMSFVYFLMLSIGVISVQTEERQKEVAVIH